MHLRFFITFQVFQPLDSQFKSLAYCYDCLDSRSLCCLFVAFRVGRSRFLFNSCALGFLLKAQHCADEHRIAWWANFQIVGWVWHYAHERDEIFSSFTESMPLNPFVPCLHIILTCLSFSLHKLDPELGQVLLQL